ncbi:hypothetical protein APUTEX25_004992 [Auxenochlorella protothecoides]|uniref:Calcineurin-like phosphoesterase domain-containing protein n=1 Tax=Auxenochlorella protothecoides TaxID=3075 RepID=A0A3M7L4N1_AUXPR|nr:hypothetical protein APUTEX25_004992 [Auxenochlorella protothecoides]|eukprot:RMZ56930.1 hypothetical protein APUTEX25_004992 [Auxenochlorella protothecoides]
MPSACVYRASLHAVKHRPQPLLAWTARRFRTVAPFTAFPTPARPRLHASASCEAVSRWNTSSPSSAPPSHGFSSNGGSDPDTKESAAPFAGPPVYVKAPGRIVAVGDIHGDLNKAVSSLQLAGVLGRDEEGRALWTGADTTLVQLGDVLDRGDCEIGVLLLLRELDRQARLEQGAVWMLNGNHESLNVAGDFRYVTPGAFWECAVAAGISDAELERDPRAALRARWELYRPGGRMAVDLAANPTVLVVNDIVFAHGGLLPHHLVYGLERINAEVAAWMSGAKGGEPGAAAPLPPFLAMGDGSSIMWNRTYGREQFGHGDRQAMEEQLLSTLRALRARAMVVGHTPQTRGLNCECGGRVWRVDVGMSAGVLDADPAILELSAPDERGLVTATAKKAPGRWSAAAMRGAGLDDGVQCGTLNVARSLFHNETLFDHFEEVRMAAPWTLWGEGHSVRLPRALDGPKMDLESDGRMGWGPPSIALTPRARQESPWEGW